MKTSALWLAGVLGLLFSSSSSFANNWAMPQVGWGGNYLMPVRFSCYPQAPDACGPGYYVYCPGCCTHGTLIGPNYYLVPPFPPFQGILPPPCGPNGCAPGPANFPSHPFVRSPRDFFMWNEAAEDMLKQGRMGGWR